MPNLNLKPTHKPVRTYYEALEQYARLGVVHETAVKLAFHQLLESCGRQFNWTLVSEWAYKRPQKQPIRIDGALVDDYNLARAYWEAKDSKDDLPKAIQKKFADGYPKDNIIFQQPDRAILYQDGKSVMDQDITQPQSLVDVVRQFFEYRPPAIEQWERAAKEFGERVKDHATELLNLIREQENKNTKFIDAFNTFLALCQQSINPNLAKSAVEEMLIQHLLTERIFRSVFNNPDFAQRNIIAVEIEKVINALTSKSFSRTHFLSSLDRFYGAIEETAATLDDFSQKQDFLNRVYERFFQGFSLKVADTHGIVYTPQPIVNFMVKSVEDILQREFGKSLVDQGVHILDPFVGTGNFIIRVMREIASIQKSALPYKFQHELHCNEVMLLPYYIASMNIEHEYFEQTGDYLPFEGLCLVDTFEDISIQQLDIFSPENMKRVQQQRQSDIFVIIGNPPYNAAQLNENDNNKNRKYRRSDRQGIDDRVSDTYAKDSSASLLIKLSDPYVKAIRWASDRIKDEGIIALVTNNSFINELSFDGMREHLQSDFNRIYCLNLKGNIRKDSMLDGVPLGEKHTVFGLAAMVGISITFFIKKNKSSEHKIFYSEVKFRSTRKEKFEFLDKSETAYKIVWEEIYPDTKNNWLTKEYRSEFDEFIAIASKEKKALDRELDVVKDVIFHKYSLGISTNRDNWLYAENIEDLKVKVKLFCETYNTELERWKRANRPENVLNFVTTDDKKVKWSSLLVDKFKRGKYAEFDESKIRYSQYRPFTKKFIYFDNLLIDAPTLQRFFFPTTESENENYVISLTGPGSEKPFMALTSNNISDLHLVGAGCTTQCFPFYTYAQDGTNRKENITDWALKQFQSHYQDTTITKWDIFYYTYALLHHPHYRERYAANLKRELPRIPFAPIFRPFVDAGKRLSEIHTNYEEQPEYPLKHQENKDLPIDWYVEKMRLNKDKTQLTYNDFLTLIGIPPEVFEYRLGNRSALEWIIEQYQVSTDKRSGITNDPNRLDDEQYILQLIKKVITVSLETVKIVQSLADLELPN